ncbi:hypothetical protein [Hyunsoonleella pacifica]|uniref:Uncharacterized protein n=1 Tax=Hyunsoonleella pacifica TaxID=1080224 RepID=A0A4Q9FRQ0_9FLAO|nr:hypothetical protein [Hyunsoonleella pacifica]TBN17787.1 hypothetical protein EYD46_05605 [Hyunsoonleella pacifica]GGD08959.1 hypothetical protein GCM10011368_08620 [Hyunsoonleella pacifica]
MDAKQFNQLLKEVKGDPKLLHSLIFETEKAIDKLEFLDRKTKASILALDPEEFIGVITGDIGTAAGCDVTCTSSCGVTCNQSCGYTTNLVNPGDFRTLALNNRRLLF